MYTFSTIEGRKTYTHFTFSAVKNRKCETGKKDLLCLEKEKRKTLKKKKNFQKLEMLASFLFL
jgi:hypothetical protein